MTMDIVLSSFMIYPVELHDFASLNLRYPEEEARSNAASLERVEVHEDGRSYRAHIRRGNDVCTTTPSTLSSTLDDDVTVLFLAAWTQRYL